MNRRTPIALISLLCSTAFATAHAATYYVRTDGGSATLCDGTADLSLAQASAGHCAWAGPMIALPPAPYGQVGVPRIAAGDTLQIAAGSYMIGYGAPGSEGICTASASYICTMAPVPSGLDAEHPTTIVGATYEDLSQATLAGPGHYSVVPLVELWGNERVYSILNLDSSSFVDISGLELTDHDSCVRKQCGGSANPYACPGTPDQIDACNDSTPPYGPWGENGIVGDNTSNVSLTSVVVHGMAAEGVVVGRMTDWSVNSVRIIGNGFAGWDADVSVGGSDASNHGTLAFTNVEIAWNGCGERYPSGRIYGCWGQNQGGYGDGFATGHTSGHWIFERAYIHDNVSDGLDLLYGDNTATVEVRHSKFTGNAGNQLKVRSISSLIEDNVINGMCAEGWSSFPPNNYTGPYVPSDFVGRFNMDLAANCRASGDAVALSYLDGSAHVFRNNTVAGQSSCLLVNSMTGADGGDTGATLLLANNIFDGNYNINWAGFASGGAPSLVCGVYDYNASPTTTFSHNIFWGVKDGQCPLGSICADPLMANDLTTQLDTALSTGSPAIGAGDVGQCPIGVTCDIGVLSF